MRLAYDAHMLSKFVLSFGSVNSILQKSAFLVVLPKRFIQTSDAQGPAKDTLSAAAFQVTRQQASDAFKEYHAGHWFATKPSSGLEKIKETFLPYWITRANASVQLKGARIGFDVWVQRWNPASRRSEARIETSWQWVRLERAFWEQGYPAEDPGMQVYASYKYPRPEIDKLKPGAAASIARRFDGSMVVSDYDGSTRRVGPFQMKPAVALRFAQNWIRKEEEKRARALLRSSYRCDRVGEMDMSVELSDIRSSPVYFPVFVFRSTHFGNKLRTFVSGISSHIISGTRALDETRIALAAGAVSALAIAATGMYASLSVTQVWWFGIATPAVLVGFAARYYTHARQSWNAYWTRQEQAKQEAENEQSSWDPEWVKDYARLEEEYRNRDESENTRNFSFTGQAGDSGGYYRVLGVSPGATKQEIQAAYRGLVMKHHPDKVPEPEKEEASKVFRRVQEAYSTLRDPGRRARYDSGQ